MDVTSLFKAVFALAVVLGLILALAYGLRRYAPNVLARLSAPRGRKRLEVLETLVLDPTRRVVIVRVDDEERLILLGEGHELVEPRPLAGAKPAEPRVRPVVEAPIPVPRPRPVAVAPAQTAQPAPGQPRTAQAPASPPRVKLAAARAAYPRPAAQDAPTLQDDNDDLF